MNYGNTRTILVSTLSQDTYLEPSQSLQTILVSTQVQDTNPEVSWSLSRSRVLCFTILPLRWSRKTSQNLGLCTVTECLQRTILVSTQFQSTYLELSRLNTGPRLLPTTILVSTQVQDTYLEPSWSLRSSPVGFHLVPLVPRAGTRLSPRLFHYAGLCHTNILKRKPNIEQHKNMYYT